MNKYKRQQIKSRACLKGHFKILYLPMNSVDHDFRSPALWHDFLIILFNSIFGICLLL